MAAAHISPFAGTWYPERAAELEKLLDGCFARPLSAATPSGAWGSSFPMPRRNGPEPVAAAVYREIERQRPERIIVLAFPHRGGLRGVAVPDVSVIRTPLGPLPLEPLDFPAAPEACLCDHSFEIQIPFLQRAAPSAAVTGLYVGSMSAAERRSGPASSAAHWRPGTVFLASSDFTHYGRSSATCRFPRTGRRPRACTNWISSASMRWAASIRPCSRTARQTCARHGLRGRSDRSAARNARPVDSGRAFLDVLDYRTSGEIGNDFRHSVSYAALGIYPREAFYLDESDAAALLDSAERTLSSLRVSRRREPVPVNGSPALEARRGVFVSLHRDGELLGCVGNATGRKSLAADTPEMALAAALDDPRFGPAALSRGAVDIEISMLTPFRRLGDTSRFCCGRDDGLLEIGARAGLLLPQVADGRGWSAEDFLAALAARACSVRAPGGTLAPGFRFSTRRSSADQVFPADLELVQVAQHREGDLLGIEEGLRDPLHVVGGDRSMLSTSSSSVKNRLKYISCRARLAMRLEVDSRPSISEPFRWSLARRSSSSGTGSCFSCRNSLTIDSTTLPAPIRSTCRRRSPGSRYRDTGSARRKRRTPAPASRECSGTGASSCRRPESCSGRSRRSARSCGSG